MPATPPGLIGYTRKRRDDPRGQFYNWLTSRACVVPAAGGGAERELAPALVDRPGAWTQFAGWSPDGQTAIVCQCWEDEATYQWEREHQTFRMTEGWLVDSWLVPLAPSGGAPRNVTAVERVSAYNTGLFYWPGDPARLGFQALIAGVSHPYSMAADGRHKRDLTCGPAAFTYGFTASADGQRIAYHKDYQVYLADADGSHATRVDTGHPFHFCPIWSPDGQWVLFLDGTHYDCQPTLVDRSGRGARKLADRRGHPGVIEMLVHPDFHSASSDTPVWAPDSRWVYYTARYDGALELCRVSLGGAVERLTRSAPGVENHHPQVSPDGGWVLWTSDATGTKQLHVAGADGSDARPITCVPPGCMAAHGHWQPGAGS